MAFTLTVADVEDYTGIDLINEEISKVNTAITNAKTEIQNRTSRTFADTDSDIITIRRAVSFLTAFYIRTKNKEIEMAKTDLGNYHREFKEFHGDITPETKSIFRPKLGVVTNADLDD